MLNFKLSLEKIPEYREFSFIFTAFKFLKKRRLLTKIQKYLPEGHKDKIKIHELW